MLVELSWVVHYNSARVADYTVRSSPAPSADARSTSVEPRALALWAWLVQRSTLYPPQLHRISSLWRPFAMHGRLKKGKGSPYLITERRVPELIPVLGSQPAVEVSHKPGGRLLLKLYYALA